MPRSRSDRDPPAWSGARRRRCSGVVLLRVLPAEDRRGGAPALQGDPRARAAASRPSSRSPTARAADARPHRAITRRIAEQTDAASDGAPHVVPRGRRCARSSASTPTRASATSSPCAATRPPSGGGVGAATPRPGLRRGLVRLLKASATSPSASRRSPRSTRRSPRRGRRITFAAKADAGAEFAVTQFFFDAADYFRLASGWRRPDHPGDPGPHAGDERQADRAHVGPLRRRLPGRARPAAARGRGRPRGGPRRRCGDPHRARAEAARRGRARLHFIR